VDDGEPSEGLVPEDGELEPKDGGRGGDGGAAGRGGWCDIGAAAGFGAMGGGEGRGIGADEPIGVMLGGFAAAFGADLRAAFLRAGFAFFAVLRFAAGRPRRLAVPRLPFFAPVRAAAVRRFAPLAFARAPFLRPRFDFDFALRAIKPPVSGMKFAASSVALRRPARMQEDNGFVKPIPVRIIGHLLH
jgi:hypothetical protein